MTCVTIQKTDRQVDPKLRLNDIWVLETLEGEKIELAQLQKNPYLEFNLAEQRVIGHDGCNSLSGSIRQVDSTLLLLNPVATTRMMCLDMKIPNQFGRLLSRVKNYKIEDKILYIYDEQASEIMTFGKTD